MWSSVSLPPQRPGLLPPSLRLSALTPSIGPLPGHPSSSSQRHRWGCCCWCWLADPDPDPDRWRATCLGGVVGCVCMFVCTELCGRPSVGTLCVRCVLCALLTPLPSLSTVSPVGVSRPVLRVLSLFPPVPLFLSTVGRIVIIDSPVTDHSLAHQPAPAPQARAQLQTLPPSVTDLSAPAGAARTRRRGRRRGEPPRRPALDETRHTRSLSFMAAHRV